MFALKSLLLRVVAREATVHPSRQSFPPTRTNLHFTGCHQVTPLLNDMLQADTGQGQPDLPNDVVLGKAVEVIDLHHQRGFRHLCLAYLMGRHKSLESPLGGSPAPRDKAADAIKGLSL